MKTLPSSVIFIGAGPSALFAARRLKQLAKEQGKEIKCILVERELEVGGKCRTFSDPDHHELKTEWGAGAVAANYGVVIDALKEHGIAFENMLPIETQTIELRQKYDKLTISEKMMFIKKLVEEITVFNSDYDVYKNAKQNKMELPEELSKPFEKYAALKKMEHLPLFLKPLVPGFGYGSLSHCPTYSILEYLGKMTIPEILIAENILKQPGLLAIHGGFQLLMAKIAAGFDVRLGAQITQIERALDKVTVHYLQDGVEHSETAEVLVLATSPKNWPSLNLKLTDTEKKCVNQLEYYRYPVAVYRIKGLPPKQYYFPKALEESGFGHLALITSRDNRKEPEEGRLCTIYINLPSNNNNYVIDHELIQHELKSIGGVTGSVLVKDKVWEDYMSTLPWEVRLELDKEQQDSNTLYLGSYALGGFEDVVCVANKATDTINEFFSPNMSYEENGKLENIKRAWYFFSDPVYAPISSFDKHPDPTNRCMLF
ncbi:FAD-dependent oxidoreductase [Legionella maioricensis]|uniref:Tryptophan 2-monooxygenase n=1 Tax=Legionella maioricensis TaxID=2896528 RepID=A0A9X2CXZ3_9GAMM|nr:FAD-dependent oxidoreductase [Legionella maioricensis]MCL9682944.1 FAD-dependent oxidoreductase [Legionella maioricensis]MCL9686292.1 FAD-dependent oxidoreductase [Legionella maioricensis]